ncbi:unnamed protein product [Mesocestoides corti]|uniref:LINES_N domain-containing protein n=1 Tax=Mesocestoides corti TaxID=53468 RepID=A0A0R3UAG9_MESCO|nr:unnamed protein product [Mesocestoides corti]
MITKKILEKLEGCEPPALLVLLTESAPSNFFLQNIDSRWVSIRKGVENLITTMVTNPTPLGLVKTQNVLTCWKRCLKALHKTKENLELSPSRLLVELHQLLAHALDNGLPSSLAYSLIRLLHKSVEVLFYDEWSFALRPSTSCAADDHLRAGVLSLVSNIDLASWSRSVHEDNLFDFGPRCYRLLVYTITRLAFALGESTRPSEIHLPSAHHLFTRLLESIDFDRYTLIDWLVSPETDFLAYLFAYSKRVCATDQRRWCLPVNWHQKPRVVELLNCLVESLKKLQSAGALPFSADLLVDRLARAIKVLIL